MNQGRTVFAQLLDFFSHDEFIVRSALPWQPKCTAFFLLDSVSGHGLCPTDLSRQPSRYRSLLRAQRGKLYHCGLTARIHAPPWPTPTRGAIGESMRLRTYPDRPPGRFTPTPILGWISTQPFTLWIRRPSIFVFRFPLGQFQRAKGAIKLHTMIEVHSSIPVFIHITHGKVHDINALDVIVPEPGSFFVMDRGYVDFARLYALHRALAFFVIRAKEIFQFRRRTSHPWTISGLRSDQTIVLTGPLSRSSIPSRFAESVITQNKPIKLSSF